MRQTTRDRIILWPVLLALLAITVYFLPSAAIAAAEVVSIQ